ncbi:hypothetical protein F4861DRAFT_363072 [Xylaria intraflava]|nr:hypothetical protein F4861DRAFT_363072 [Xylaria intraflava]
MVAQPLCRYEVVFFLSFSPSSRGEGLAVCIYTRLLRSWAVVRRGVGFPCFFSLLPISAMRTLMARVPAPPVFLCTLVCFFLFGGTLGWLRVLGWRGCAV